MIDLQIYKFVKKFLRRSIFTLIIFSVCIHVRKTTEMYHFPLLCICCIIQIYLYDSNLFA